MNVDMEAKKTVRVLSILKNLHEACLFLCLLLLLLQLVGSQKGGAGLGPGHQACSLWLCFSIKAIKGLHSVYFAVCPSSVK